MNDQMPTLRWSRPRKLSATMCSFSSPQFGYSKHMAMADMTSNAAPISTIRYQLMIMPTPMPNRPRAINTGYSEGAGMWILLKSTRAGAVIGGPVSLPGASTLPYFVTQKASREMTVGTAAKLYSGGGEGTDHSSVRASHGSLEARSP